MTNHAPNADVDPSATGGRAARGIGKPHIHHVSSLERPDQSRRAPSNHELRLMRASLMHAVDLCPRIINEGPSGNHAQIAQIKAWLSGCAIMAEMYAADRDSRVSFLIAHMFEVGAIVPVEVGAEFRALGRCVLVLDLGALAPAPEHAVVTVVSGRFERMIEAYFR